MNRRREPAEISRIILVTGGANGLGAALVRHFIAAGDHVANADIDRVASQQLVDDTGRLFIHTDVGVLADNQAAGNSTVEHFGGMDAVRLTPAFLAARPSATASIRTDTGTAYSQP